MLQKLVDIVSLLWVFLQYARYELFSLSGNLNVLGECDFVRDLQ
jgi:hypothetical protein